jgi:hypothetical protein
MGLTSDIANAVATKVGAVAGIRGASPRDPDTIPVTPWAVVALPRITIEAGSFETMFLEFPLRMYVARVSDGTRVTQAAYDTFDDVMAALWTGISYGMSAQGVAQGLLDEVDFDKFWEVGGEIYQGWEGTLTVTVAQGRTWTA